MINERYPISNLNIDEKDERDLIFVSERYDNLPKKIDNRNWIGEIENQLNTNSCVANATSSALELLAKRNGKSLDLSRLFLYYTLRESYDNLKGKDSGSYLRDGFKMCNKIGICEEQYWQFLVNRVNIKPNNEAYKMANENKVNEYKRIISHEDNTISNIKSAINLGYPIIFSMELDKSFYSMEKILSKQKYKGTNLETDIVGYHAMNIVGYDDELNGFIIENSWGANWGYIGCCIIDYDVFFKDCHDIWVCTSFKDYKLDSYYIEPEPKKNLKFYLLKVKNFFNKYMNKIVIGIFVLTILFFIYQAISSL